MTAIRIGRLDSRYAVPPGPTPPVALQARLDRAAREHLAPACEAAAAGLCEAAPGEVWLVRHLDVAVDVDLARTASPAAVARAWSQRLMLALRAALASGGAGEHLMRFPSSAAWTARLASELAAGTAWDRWYLRAFESLRALPAGRAVAEAIVREPGETREVLAELSRAGDLEIVLLTLGPGDARRVVDAVGAQGPVEAAAGRRLARDLAGLGVAVRPPDEPHLPGSVLRLLAAAVRHGVALPPGAQAVAAAVVVVAGLLARGAEPSRLAAALTAARWAEVLRLAGQRPQEMTADVLGAVELLAEVAAGDTGWVAALAGALAPAAPAERAAGGEAVVVATPAGGLLLLWPSLVEMWPRVLDGAGDMAPVQRLLVAARLFGRRRREALLRDPVLALLCGLERPPPPARLAEARAALGASGPGPAALAAAAADGPQPDAGFFGDAADALDAAADRFAAAVLARFAARLPGFAASSPGYLLRNFLDVPASVHLGEGVWEASVVSPPLQLVLHMAGMSRLRLDLAWTREPVTLEVRWT